MNKTMKCVLLVIGVLLLVYVVCMCLYKKEEKFAVDGALNGSVPIGGLKYNSYDMVEPTMDTFADIVAPSEPYGQSRSNCSSLPFPQQAGKNVDYRDLLPDVNTHTTSYDIDVSDPEVFMWRPSVRASIHNRQHATADPYRGDLPIEKDSCGYSSNGWFSSRYGPGDSRLDGFFSEFSNAKFRSLTGQKSYPSQIANEELVMDYQGPNQAGSQLTMEWF